MHNIYGKPLRWDEVRRAQLRAELDAYYARLYGLARDELRYILDPKEVYGEDFPGETFRVLKEKEVKQFGDAPRTTRRLASAASGGTSLPSSSTLPTCVDRDWRVERRPCGRFIASVIDLRQTKQAVFP